MIQNKSTAFIKTLFNISFVTFFFTIILGSLLLWQCSNENNNFNHTFNAACVIDSITYKKEKEYINNEISMTRYNIDSAKGYITFENTTIFHYYTYYEYYEYMPSSCTVVNNEPFNCRKNVSFSCFYNDERRDVLKTNGEKCNFSQKFVLFIMLIIISIFGMYNTFNKLNELQ